MKQRPSFKTANLYESVLPNQYVMLLMIAIVLFSISAALVSVAFTIAGWPVSVSPYFWYIILGLMLFKFTIISLVVKAKLDKYGKIVSEYKL